MSDATADEPSLAHPWDPCPHVFLQEPVGRRRRDPHRSCRRRSSAPVPSNRTRTQRRPQPRHPNPGRPSAKVKPVARPCLAHVVHTLAHAPRTPEPSPRRTHRGRAVASALLYARARAHRVPRLATAVATALPHCRTVAAAGLASQCPAHSRDHTPRQKALPLSLPRRGPLTRTFRNLASCKALP